MRISHFLLPALILFGSVSSSSAATGVARIWNEQQLSAIRVDRPHPPVQARNLFSVSAAMYDAWAAYDVTAVGYVYRGKHSAMDIAAARREAVSYAAYRMLRERYALSLRIGKIGPLLGPGPAERPAHPHGEVH